MGRLLTLAALLAAGMFLGVLVDELLSQKRVSDQIQESRADAVRDSCDDRNERHGIAYTYVAGLAATSPRSRHLPKEAQERLALEFTDAIVGEVRNCDDVVDETVYGKIRPRKRAPAAVP